MKQASRVHGQRPKTEFEMKLTDRYCLSSVQSKANGADRDRRVHAHIPVEVGNR